MWKRTLEWVDGLLNGITMYRLVLYYLIGLVVAAFALAAFGVLPYSPAAVAFSAIFLTLVCLAANGLFAKAFDAPVNVESAYITALILALIVTPPRAAGDMAYFSIAVWASAWAMASKFILAIGKKHLFNPAAFAVALTALTLGLSATWWVATPALLPFVLVGGLLLVRKLIRFDLVLAFLGAALVSVLVTGGSAASLGKALALSPLFFFAFVMLTEPLTTPPTRPLRIAYGILVGILFAPNVHVGSVYSTPELALLVGNLFSYAVSPKRKLVLALEGKRKLAPDTYEFSFVPGAPLAFRPGQYMEWTLDHRRPDARGNRRYFTVASSPTEDRLRLGVKFYPDASTFKHALAAMDGTAPIVASQLAGDFTLPRDPGKKLAFIAGGIGITPFRSMARYLMDTGDRRDVVLFYSNQNADGIAYKDFFDEAARRETLRVVYTLTGTLPADWKGEVGFIDAAMIAKHAPDFRDRTFYISGSHGMVTAFENILRSLGVRKRNIRTDFFPGLV